MTQVRSIVDTGLAVNIDQVAVSLRHWEHVGELSAVHEDLARIGGVYAAWSILQLHSITGTQVMGIGGAGEGRVNNLVFRRT